MKTLNVILCAVVSLAFAHSPFAEDFAPDVETEKKPWTSLDALNNPDAFQFAIVTDRTGGHRDGIFEDGVKKLNLLQPEFVMSVGDLIEGYTEDLAEIDKQWVEFTGFTAQLEMPFFYVPGNHDISNNVMREEWDKRFGRSYYHFIYKNVLFLCLNSEDPPSTQMSPEQVAYIKATLAEHTDVRWTLVFLHKPMWKVGEAGSGWSEVQEALKGRPHSVFAGHTHNYYAHDINDSDYVVLATMGGGSNLRGQNFGEFDHFMWVTMTPEGPRLANLMLSGIWDKDVLNDERMALIRPVVSGEAVRTDGIVSDTPLFEKAETTLRLTNDADVPMKVDLFMLQGDVLRSEQRRIVKEVPPNSVELVPMEIFAAAPSDPKTLAPLKAQWTVSYPTLGGANPLTLRGQHRIVVDSAFAVIPAPGVTVDGELGEWGALNVNTVEPGQVVTTADTWWGNQDASIQFTAAYNQDYLFVAADVTDDERRFSPKDPYTQQDSVELRIDARPADARNGGRPGKDYLLIAAVPGQEPNPDLKLPPTPEGVQVASKVRRFGYTLEFAIPIALLNEAQGGAWESLRLNLGLNDYDDGRVATKVWFRPDWDGAANYAGSGNFVRK